MSATSPPTPDGDHWFAEDLVSPNGATGDAPVERHPRDGAQRLVVLGYITAAAMPPVGFVLGLVVAARLVKANPRHGALIVVVSIVAAAIWTLIISSGALTATNGSY
jgi:hypothetical protein